MHFPSVVPGFVRCAIAALAMADSEVASLILARPPGNWRTQRKELPGAMVFIEWARP
jgi:hypothetical protein